MILRQACRASTRPALHSRASRIRCRPAPISEQIHSARRDCTGCSASRTLHSSTGVIGQPQMLLNRGSIHKARHYATHTDLPASTSATSPPPSRKHKAPPPDLDIPDVDEEIDSEVSLSKDPWTDLYELTNANTVPYKLAARDPNEVAAIESMLAFAEEMSGGPTDEQPLRMPRTTLNVKLQAKSPWRTAKKPLIQAQRTLPAIRPKTISEQTFEEFREYHRQQQYRLDYAWRGQTSPAEPPQPHHQALVSRYDWRLRNPRRTRQQEQKEQYAMKNINLRTDVNHAQGVLPGLDEYQAKYLNFISMERTHAEQTTLLRLYNNAGLNLEHLRAVRGRPLESLSGLLAQQQQRRGPVKAYSKHGGEVFHFTKPRHTDFPANAFHRGAMVYIWKCTYDQYLHEWVVPDLQEKGLAPHELLMKPARGFVAKDWSNRIDIESDTFEPEEGAFYRIDLGYDGTTFDRMEKAVKSLSLDATAMRLANERGSLGAHAINSHVVALNSTELRSIVLASDKRAKFEPSKEHESPVLMDDQHIASWAHRYSRASPIRMAGDPDLGLNDTQLRAVANAIMNKFSLIQGPPGTGKTATIVAALKLLKVHFQVAAPILVCAHTNAVVDMIVDKCVQEGLHPLRLGRETRIREDMKEYGMEGQARKHRQYEELTRLAHDEDSMRARKDDLYNLLQGKGTVQAVFADLEGSEGHVESKLKPLTEEEKHEIRAELEILNREMQDVHAQHVKLLRWIQADIIASSDICLSTCLSALTSQANSTDFPIVFIDEAGQCDEPTTLIPLVKGSRHVVLIGDHKQLPSVCNSDEARQSGLNNSLFERLKSQASVPSIQLDVQYRMLPEISAFPNKTFYDGTIRDSEERKLSGRRRSSGQSPVTFLHHTHLESRVGHSIANEGEADGIIRHLMDIRATGMKEGMQPEDALSHVGVIVMYAAQADLIRQKAREALGEDHGVEIHTVDGFQGRDKDTIIISTVRSSVNRGIGFLKDPRRLNVALTRVRNQLYVFGNADTLAGLAWWKYPTVPSKYIKWLRKNNFIRNME